MSQRLTEIAYAKLNLALHVRERRPDGYHALESLFAFVDDGDRLTAAAADDILLEVDGLFADELGPAAENLAYRALTMLHQQAGVQSGIHVTLTKRVPVASGIGGGSGDAAAALRLACRIWNIPPGDSVVQRVAQALGADVPACLASVTAFASGIGHDLTPISPPGVEGRAALLLNPLIPCPTGPVFARWDGVDRGSLDVTMWERSRNDLQEPAIALCPDIAEVLTVLKAQLPSVVRMSGSGGTCFALFDSTESRDAAAQRIIGDHGDWWIMSGRLR